MCGFITERKGNFYYLISSHETTCIASHRIASHRFASLRDTRTFHYSPVASPVGPERFIRRRTTRSRVCELRVSLISKYSWSHSKARFQELKGDDSGGRRNSRVSQRQKAKPPHLKISFFRVPLPHETRMCIRHTWVTTFVRCTFRFNFFHRLLLSSHGHA